MTNTIISAINDEARELSWTLQNTIYVIKKGNSYYTQLSTIQGDEVISTWKLGNKIY
jgi:hypothetical protein